jgi:hypothetical protein
VRSFSAHLTLHREYQEGLDVQEEASSYQEVLRQAVAGRIQVTNGFLNELVRDDILRQKNLGLELTPLQAELWKKREEIQPVLSQSDPPLEHEFTSLKLAIDLLRSMVGTIGDDAFDAESREGSTNWRRNEIAIVQTEIRRLQLCLNDQNKANAALEKYATTSFSINISGKLSSFVQFTMRESSTIVSCNLCLYICGVECN